ncbi:DUF4932 domain-containing protein [Winogradskyella flava]|uniref:DUF4932 domain-containing protein n=1 Tax=Winogradskyella flava TaxID=1884876 RepID=UPI0024913FF0|nr:DUF4932 domain-containing protein [Winogradskyella flava]
MKKTVLMFFLIASGITVCQENQILEKPVVDQRIELLSIVFRLAENSEYSSRRFPIYIEKIEKHFNQYKNHDLIKYVKNNLKKRGIGYDAVMSMSISISSPPEFNPLLPFSETLPDKRWSEKRAEKFLRLLRKFYLDTNCELFFKENHELYHESSKRFIDVYNNLDIEWFTKFYGEKPKGVFRIINGLGNGGANYGPKIVLHNEEVIYAIMGTWSVDSLGMPKYNLPKYFPTLLHEFSHSYVNHLIKKHENELRKSGQVIFKPLKDGMKSQAYSSWNTMYAEGVVRASVIKYMKDHNYDENFIKAEIKDEIDKGFIWTLELVNELECYDANRDQYLTLEDFMPEIVQFFNQTAINIDEIEEEIEYKRPKVVKIIPFNNGSQNVNSSINKIEVLFDRPLKGKGYSISQGSKGKRYFPEIGKVSYSKSRTSLIIELKLKKNKKYQFILTGKSFKSEKGFGMNNYEIFFKTAKN